jgi:hypothetical protein
VRESHAALMMVETTPQALLDRLMA